MEKSTDKLANDPPSTGKSKRRIAVFDVLVVVAAILLIYFIRKS